MSRYDRMSSQSLWRADWSGIQSAEKFGVHPANSAAANKSGFQRALDSGEVTILPKGVYLTDGGLQLKDESCLIGQHPKHSRIHLAPNQTEGAHLFSLAGDGVADYTLQRLWLYGDYNRQPNAQDAININDTAFTNCWPKYPHYEPPQTGNSPSGFNAYQSHADPRVKLEQLQIHGFSGHGIYWHSRGSSELNNVTIYAVGKNGLYFEGFDCHFDNVHAGPTGWEGFRIVNSASFGLEACKVWFTGWKDHTKSAGFKLEASDRIRAANCEAQDTGGHGWHLDASCELFTGTSLSSESVGSPAFLQRSLPTGYDTTFFTDPCAYYVEGSYNCFMGCSAFDRLPGWTDPLNFTGTRTVPSMKYGLNFAGAAANNVFVGVILPLTPTSGMGNIQNSGSSQHYANATIINRSLGGTWDSSAAMVYRNNLTNVGLPVYADNAAAIAGGLAAGRQYRTSTGVRMERY